MTTWRVLHPDLVLLRPDFTTFDIVHLVTALTARAPAMRVMVVLDAATEPLRARLEAAGATTVPADLEDADLVAAIRSAVGSGSPPPPVEAPEPEPLAWLAGIGPSTPVPAGAQPVAAEPIAAPAMEAAEPEIATMGAPAQPQPHSVPADVAFEQGLVDLPSTEVAPAPEPAEGEVSISATLPVFHLGTAAHEAVPALAASPLAEAEPIQPVRPRPARRTAGRADLVVVFSGKGGVGKSLIATNLAVALAGDGGRVALVDLDLQFGDVGVMLHTEGHPTAIDSLAQQGEQVEAEFIEEVMATGPAGVRALLAPASPEFADLVNTANLRAILRELAKGYDHVVVDTPAHLEERNLEALEMADQIIVVSSYNLASIKDTKVSLKLLQSLGIAKERLCVVLNQTHAKVGFPRSEVEENLRFRVVTALPFDPKVDECIDNGRPFILSEPKSELSKQFQVLVDHILGRSAEALTEPERSRARTNRRRFSLGRG